MYFSGRGKIFVAPRLTSGLPGPMRWFGNVPAAKINLQIEKKEHTESYSGQDLTDLIVRTAKKADVEFDLEDWSTDNLALLWHGNKSSIAASTVTAEVMPTAAVGNYLRLKYGKVSSVVVKDSAGTPATLTLGTDYSISSADHGAIKILNLGAYVQPLKVDYAYALQSNVGMFQAALADQWVRFEGLNTADTLKPVLIELYKVSFDPLSGMDLIGSDALKMPMRGSALYDDLKVGDAVLGQFGRVVDLS